MHRANPAQAEHHEHAPHALSDLRPKTPVVVEAPEATSVLVVLPTYNESRLIEGTFRRVAVFARKHPGYSFLFVDDGSRDGTPQLIERLIELSPGVPVRLHAYTVNQGKGHAVRTGFAQSAHDIVCFTDSDLAYSLRHLPRLVAALRTADVAIGSRALVPRQERKVPLGRRVMGEVFNRLARLILGLTFKDTQAGLKGFRADAADKIFPRLRLRGFAFDVELIFVARQRALRIAEIPAKVSKRHNIKATKVSLVRDPLRMLMALLGVRWNQIMGRYD